MSKKDLKKSAAAAGDHARETFEGGAVTLEDVVDIVKDYLTPRVKDTKEKVGPLVSEAYDRVSPHLANAGEKVQPYYEKTRDAVNEGYENIRPKIQEILDRTADSEHLAKAGQAVQDATQKAGKTVHEVADKAREAAQEASATPPVSAPGKKHHGHGLLTLLGAAAALGAILLAVRQLLMPRDDGWTPREPSTEFDEDVTTDFSEPDEDDAPAEDASSEHAGEDEQATGEPDVDTSAARTEEEAESIMTDEGAPAADAVQNAGEAPEQDFGAGSFVGENPPEGYTIKGNRRSMKYHTPDAAGFARTHADVWFSSEEAAQAAGFTKASR